MKYSILPYLVAAFCALLLLSARYKAARQPAVSRQRAAGRPRRVARTRSEPPPARPRQGPTGSKICLWLLLATGCLLPADLFAQNSKSVPALTLTRTTTRREVRKLGFGSTVTLLGGPAGNIMVEGWNKNEIEIVADIEVKAANEEDLNRLAAIDTFILDEGFTTFNIITTGAHDKDFIKRYAKGFPKKLIGTPWRIDYKLKVPHLTDLELNGGHGAVTLRGVEGALALNLPEGDADLNLTGGAVVATVGQGTVNVNLTGRSWRGRGASIQVASGTLKVNFPPAYSADVDANILRTGAIENNYPALAPRERTKATPNTIQSRAGNGGATLTFTVGDGTLRLYPAPPF